MTPIQPNALLVKAKEILKEVQDSCKTTHSILNRITEQGPLHLLQLEKRYQEVGSRFIEFLGHSVLRKRTAIACDRASVILKDLKHPLSARKLATLKFRIGECDEMSTVVALKTARIAPSHHVVASEKGYVTGSPDFCNLHAFVLWGVDDEELGRQVNKNRGDLEKTIRSLSKGILIDPFLGIACHTCEINTKGKDLLQYAKIWGTSHIPQSYYTTPETCPADDLIQREAQAVYELALKILPEADDPDNVAICRFLGKKMTETLNKDYPEHAWKSTYKGGCTQLWTQGSKEKIDVTAKALKARGIALESRKIVGKEDFAIVLKDPDPMVIMDLKKMAPSPDPDKKED